MKKLRPEAHSGLLLGSGAIAFVLAGLFVFPHLGATTYVKGEPQAKKEISEEQSSVVRETDRLATPRPLKGIYMTQCLVGTPTLRSSLVQFIEDTDLNAVVIDVKDFSGTIGFETTDPRFAEAAMQSCGARDMKAFLKSLHDKGIYTIARITVFQDPEYSRAHPEQAVQSVSTGRPWEDYKGLNFVDVSSEPFWEYIATLSKETYALGFDELNFDYIRYPSDGPMKDAVYKNPNKAEALEQFFSYLHEQLKPTGVVMSADLFGMTASNTDDLGIGQVLERALPYFDYIMPMVYPSHYPDGFNGLSDPNLYPYDIVHFAMERAAERTVAIETPVRTLDGEPIYTNVTVPATAEAATTTKRVATGLFSKEAYDKNKIRPWLQDFDYGKEYLPADILAQIKATNDAGLSSWIFWDPANRYDSLRAVMHN